MVDSLKASEDGLKIVDEARRRKRWQKNASIWVTVAETSEATLKRFWARKSFIDRSTFIAICEAVGVNWKEVAEPSEIQETELPVVSTAIAHSSIPNQNFVGREGAIASLNTRINQGAKITVIQASGGIGKTTLARQYLNSQGFDLVLEIPIAKEKENITPIENAIEECLKRDFEEEPGREFGVMLGRLKRQLQTRKVGVLIDNLEPALDGQGRLIQPHRRYLELLRILADSTVLSVTLITSRDRLCEPDITVDHYQLPGLDESAWQQFFASRNIDIDIPTLQAMQNTYGGNAKAMDILCGAIREDFDGNMVAYWRENSADPLVKTDLNNLVTTQFQRLQELDPEAYKLLCRLGCYRYQDVPTVSTEGLLCLLWDVPEVQRRRVIELLRNRSLVECDKAEYLLHPMIRAEASARLRASEYWEDANRKAAEFYQNSFNIILTIKDANIAFEAYYHHVAIKNFDCSAKLIFYDYTDDKHSLCNSKEMLGIASWRLGLIHQIIHAITGILDEISNFYYLSELYTYLGYSYNLIGKLQKSIYCHKKSAKLAVQYLDTSTDHNKTELFYRIKRLQLGVSINISLCQVDLGENEKALQSLEESLLSIPEAEAEEFFLSTALAELYPILSFLRAEKGLKKEAYSLAEKYEFKLSLVTNDSWAQGYSLLFMGLTYKNLGEFEKSFEMFRQAIAFAEKTHYTQVKAKALSGMAELYREQSDFTTALSHHSESIALLDKIGAKCDLAEAHYQLALTYQKMGDAEKSQTPFQEAIRLFNEMEAPKQVEKVRKAIGKIDEV
jgi:tetratricopeptide (TPR) repeat protein